MGKWSQKNARLERRQQHSAMGMSTPGLTVPPNSLIPTAQGAQVHLPPSLDLTFRMKVCRTFLSSQSPGPKLSLTALSSPS